MAEVGNHSIAFAQEASLGLPGSIKQVADFLLSEGTGIEQLTMAEIAARAFTSKPTLVRFAKQAGYAGWKDYRRDFLTAMQQVEAQRAQRVSVDVNYPFEPGASSEAVVDSLQRIHQLALSQLEEALDHQALDHAAEAVLQAHDVAFMGAMQNLQRGKVFASNLGLMGILCRSPLGEEWAAVANHFTQGDCVVVASYSGGLEHLPMEFVPLLKERGVTIIAITNSERSPLGSIADCTLGYAPLEHHHAKIAAFYSGACTSLILDALYAACYARRYDASMNRRSTIAAGLRGHIPDSLELGN